MLAERESGAGPRRLSALRIALALLIGAAGTTAATPPASAVDTGAPARLAVVVPIVVPPEKTGLIGAQALASYTSPLGVLTRQLDAVVGREVTLAIDPRIIVSARLLGQQAPATVAAWLRRLESMPQESFVLPYANADVTLATQAGMPAVPSVTSLEFAIDGELLPVPEPEPSPSTSPSATAEPVPTTPTTESLLAWPWGLPGMLWPVEGRVVASDLPLFASAGYDTVLLSSDNLEDGREAHAVVDGLDAVIAHADVSRALRKAASGTSEVSTALATITSAALPGAVDPIVATLDRAAPLSDWRLPELLDALDADPRIDLVGLSAVLGGRPTPDTLIDRAHQPELLDLVSDPVLLDARVLAYSRIAAQPDLLNGEHRLALLALLDEGWSGNPDGRALAADEFTSASHDTLRAVRIVDSSDVNFLTDRSSIQIPLRNDLDQAVTVYLSVVPDRPLLDVENPRVEVVLEPNSVRSAPVPVQSISNGTVRLTMTLLSATGEQLGSSARLTVNVQAGWEGPIVAMLAALVVLVFAGGLVRNVVRRRRERA